MTTATHKNIGDKLKFAAYFDIQKKDGLPDGQVEVIVSTPTEDRQGERINVDGIDTSHIEKSGPVMWSHDYESAPIGRIEKTWKTKGALQARVQFDMGDNFGREIYRKVKDGFIKAVSIGGGITAFGKNHDGTTDYTYIDKMSMFELSFCAIGANPDALVSLKSLEQQYLKTSDEHTYDMISKQVSSLADQVSALESALASSRVPEQETTAKRVIQRNKLVLAKTSAKLVDKNAESIISALNGLLERNQQCQTKQKNQKQ